MHPPTRLSKRRAVGVALGTLGTLAAAAALTSAASSAASPAACTSSGLVAWLDTTSNGAAGSFYYDLEFTNLSGHPCTLRGYPGLSGVTLTGAQLGSPASRNPARKPAVITLSSATGEDATGSFATVVLRIIDVANYPTSTCKPVTAAGLRVYAPGETSSTVIPFPFRACSRSGPGYLSVEAVTKGTTAAQ